MRREPPICILCQAKRAWDDFFKKFPEMRAYELSLDPCRQDKTVEEQLEEVIGPLLNSGSGREWEKPTPA